MFMLRLKPLRRLLIVLFIFIFSIFSLCLFQFQTDTSFMQLPNFRLKTTHSSCSPQSYTAGEWVHAPLTTKANMTVLEDSLEFSGFGTCASSREFWWHLGADKSEQWDRFPGAQSWAWAPGENCIGLRSLDPEEFVKHLVEDGGWYLVGDSVMENQFFSLSCILHAHVIATPDYNAGESWDRGWPQNLFLSPTSPLLSSMSFPKDFDVTKTPLVTFRRIDILFSQEELIDIHRSIQPPGTKLEDDSLFGEQAVWTVPVAEYLSEFVAPLPLGNYKTMVVSTGGHWTTETFAKTSPNGIEGVLNLFEHAAKFWADEVETQLKEHEYRPPSWIWILGPFARKVMRRRVVVRAYLPGHEDCHSFREPWKIVQPFKWNWWNWGEIWKFNVIFEKLLANRKEYPDIHYLGIDRPARLRPDAHVTGDCLHIMTGAGVLEGWTHYIWHYITREI